MAIDGTGEGERKMWVSEGNLHVMFLHPERSLRTFQ